MSDQAPLKYKRAPDLRLEIAHEVGADPTRYGSDRDRKLLKADLQRLAERLRPEDHPVDPQRCDLEGLYTHICEWAGGEFQPSAGFSWGINKDNLKLIYQELDL
jgi:hypothetical protein